MTLTSTLFKGSRIKDGICTCNNAGGDGVAGMKSLSINVIVLLIRSWESCSCIMRTPQGKQSFLTPTDLSIWSLQQTKKTSHSIIGLWPSMNILELQFVWRQGVATKLQIRKLEIHEDSISVNKIEFVNKIRDYKTYPHLTETGLGLWLLAGCSVCKAHPSLNWPKQA